MHKKLILSLILPLIALFGFFIKSEYDYRNGATWEVKITGVDPRDLLKGHYIIYRELWDFDMIKVLEYATKYKEINATNYNDNDDCLCLNGDQTNPKVYPVKCEDQNKQCNSIVKGRLTSSKISFNRFKNTSQEKQDHKYIWGDKDNISFNAGIEKFFVDESLAQSLEKEVQKRTASIVFRVSLSRKAIVKDLKLDGKDWREVVK